MQLYCLYNSPCIQFEHTLIVTTNHLDLSRQVLQVFTTLSHSSFDHTPPLNSFSDYPSSTCVSSACATWRVAASFTSTWRSATGSTPLPTRSTGRMRSLYLRWGTIRKDCQNAGDVVDRMNELKDQGDDEMVWVSDEGWHCDRVRQSCA